MDSEIFLKNLDDSERFQKNLEKPGTKNKIVRMNFGACQTDPQAKKSLSIILYVTYLQRIFLCNSVQNQNIRALKNYLVKFFEYLCYKI